MGKALLFVTKVCFSIMSVYTLHGYVYKISLDAHACHAHEEMWFVGVVFTQAEPILRVSFNSCDLITHMLLILYNVKPDL